VQWRVVMADINQAAYDKIKPTLQQDLHLFVRTDVSKFEDQLSLFKRAFQWSGGRIDFFANNAGIPDRQPLLGWLGRPELVDKEDPTEPDLSCIDVDLKAVFYGLKCFVHFVRKTRNLLAQSTVQALDDIGIDGGDAAIGVAADAEFHPKMVVTASMASQYPFYILPIYTAAKHGCVGLVRAAAPTLLEDEGITLNAIMPSTTMTNIIPKPILDQWPEENLTPLETILRAFDELTHVNGGVVQDGLSDGPNLMVKNGCCVEASTNRLFYRDPVSFPSQVQEWVGDQSKRDGILGRFMQNMMKAKRDEAA
jgi:15-hydroxyprostaglandin dehydrogenase (NAD)